MRLLGQADFQIRSSGIYNVSHLPQVLYDLFPGGITVDGFLHICPVDVVPGGFPSLFIQPHLPGWGFVGMLHHRQALLPAQTVRSVPQTF